MRFTVERKVMVSALKNISVCVGRSTLPILYNVAIEAKDGKITMTCSNLHIEFAVCIAPIEIIEDGTTSVNAKKLLSILKTLVEKGNSVVVIEHNLDVIKVADYIIDLGPNGGDRGGELVACGTPEEVAKVDASKTAIFLKKILKQ